MAYSELVKSFDRIRNHMREFYVAGPQWGNKKYMNMRHLESALDDAFIAG